MKKLDYRLILRYVLSYMAYVLLIAKIACSCSMRLND